MKTNLSMTLIGISIIVSSGNNSKQNADSQNTERSTQNAGSWPNEKRKTVNTNEQITLEEVAVKCGA